MSKNKAKTVEEFDRRFDEDESIFELADVTRVSRPNLEPQRVNVDFPKYFLQKLDREAELRGVSRQALIKTWLYQCLQFNASQSWATIPHHGQVASGVYGGGQILDAGGVRSVKSDEGAKTY
jgi:hypothetical protein